MMFFLGNFSLIPQPLLPTWEKGDSKEIRLPSPALGEGLGVRENNLCL
jgi:hypothetical protein